MKRFLALLCLLLLLPPLLTACTPSTPTGIPTDPPTSAPEETATQQSEETTIGFYIQSSKYYRSFIDSLYFRMFIREEAARWNAKLIEAEIPSDKDTVDIDRIDELIQQGADVLMIHTRGRQIEPILEKAEAANIPVVAVYEYYAGNYEDHSLWGVYREEGEEGVKAGEIIADYFKAHPEADKNNDQKIQYITLTGEPGHADAWLRIENALKAIEKTGLQVEGLATDTGMWDKEKARVKMERWLTGGYDSRNIELVLADNDDMALGAIEALQAEGYNTGDPKKYIPVVGIDATKDALEAIAEGSMLGTVLNDGKNQSIAAVRIAVAAVRGEPVTEKTIGFQIGDDKRVRIPHVKVTAENLESFLEEYAGLYTP